MLFGLIVRRGGRLAKSRYRVSGVALATGSADRELFGNCVTSTRILMS